ncbi:Reductase, putative [Penicillium digitatum]|mgnify:CR=1 FL=1|uniref:Reductase, putative n=2 Tax=Penicillium digitatum TaxID=36651 RepID=A0A7T6XFP4_PENDI|nr:Reductase, putative [Penicillium digitatum]
MVRKGDPSRNIVGVHVQDMAEAHINALDSKIVDGSKYLLAGPKPTGLEIARIVHRLYPDSGALISEDFQGVSFPVDVTKAETELGIQCWSFEEMIRDLMDQQLGFE